MTEKNDIRCICSKRPLLARFGREKTTGELFVHVKVYKQNRIYAEMFVSANATIKLRCRDCLRIQTVKIISDRPLLKEEREMMELLAPGPAKPRVATAHDDRVR